MISDIKCPHCGQLIKLSQAFREEIEEEESKSLKKQKEEFELKAKQQAEEIEEEKARNRKLLNEISETNKMIRELKRKDEERQLKYEKQLMESEEKIRKSAVAQIEEKDKFKFEEYEKKLADMTKALDEAKKKGSQGSQQLQGEVLELDLENLLKTTFNDDEIIAVAKGQLGGDIIHKVKGKSGRIAGVILWETKRANWQKSWLSKLREDARKEDATVSVLVSVNLPNDINDFKLAEGIVICSYKYALPLAAILRRSVLHIAFAKQTAENKDDNLELLYKYLQSEAFRHRFEAFAEGIIDLQNDLETERRSMERGWKRREMQINKMMINAARMYGELQGVMGNALPDIKNLSLPQR